MKLLITRNQFNSITLGHIAWRATILLKKQIPPEPSARGRENSRTSGLGGKTNRELAS